MNNLLIVSDVRLHRDGLAHLLTERHEFGAVHTSSTLDETLKSAYEHQPAVVLLDMVTRSCLEYIRPLAIVVPVCKILAFAVGDEPEDVIACAEAGAAGYIPASASADDLIRTVFSVTHGELPCSPRIASTLFQRLGRVADVERADAVVVCEDTEFLTVRERDVLLLIERGLSNKEIARALSIGLATVKNHVHHVLTKLNVARRGEAAARARPRENGKRPGVEAVRA